MLRQFRRSDVAHLFPLMERHFPDENRLFGFRPEAFQRLVHNIFRPHIQF